MINDEEFGKIELVANIDNRIKKLHEEFAVKECPEYSNLNMVNIWVENWELREKILLCQREYIQENESKNKNYRLYVQKLRDIESIKKKHAKEKNALQYLLDEAKITIEELSKELKSAKDLIAKIEGKEEDKTND